MNAIHDAIGIKQSLADVTVAAAVFVQRVDDFMSGVSGGELSEKQAQRLQEYRAAAQIITQALVGAASAPASAPAPAPGAAKLAD